MWSKGSLLLYREQLPLFRNGTNQLWIMEGQEEVVSVAETATTHKHGHLLPVLRHPFLYVDQNASGEHSLSTLGNLDVCIFQLKHTVQ